MENPEKILQSIVDLLEDDSKIGIMLAAQMGTTPQEVQLVMQVADYDEESFTVTSGDTYIVRCIGVQEHRLSLGMFNRMATSADHPLLWNHNYRYQQIYFRALHDNIEVDDFMLELNQLYGQHYGNIRSLAMDINRMAPLGTILGRGNGLLGEMPKPMAEIVKDLMERYGYECTLVDAEEDEPPMAFKLLVMDDSYFIASLYSADKMSPSK